ncbi:Na/Pi symporter [Pallidibacillus thermolactis]|uniref:Na/Pi symporter n=1 Tax=Pallidibacillus thermolactis TaxID=251051 RepID=UPI0021D9937F|nr:Na/Pi symporter [Pallidibacillus thermolactis]MCU9600565.1 Na/Pi symporter [Pallidibacillus thermolactis subsp. kokeshiiformis]MED1674364.1 Na/Pi symporter [Pallidibacillus thermolactis subsp. kokeshiiformis]
MSFLLFILYLTLFLGGMYIMRLGLKTVSHKKISEWLLKFTSSPITGLVFGTFLTVLLQSSSAVMIITVGFVSANLISFKQSIGIILGTNIGTTATLEFLAFGTEQFIIPLLIFGSLCLLFRVNKIRSFGLFFYGLGAIFMALFGFERLAAPLAESEVIGPFLLSLEANVFLSVIAGCVITALIQSSTAMTGIAMGFLQAHAISLPVAIGVMLGSNIGTCLDAYVASLGGGKEAKKTAWAHIWLNVLGVMIFIPFISQFSQIVSLFASTPDNQLAHASVLFNLIVSFIFLPFVNPFARFIEKIHG